MTVEQFRFTIAGMMENISDPAPYNEIARMIERSIQKNFNQEGRYGELGNDNIWEGGNKPWKGLREKSIAQRKRKGHWPGKILQDTGATKSSVFVLARPGVVTLGAQTTQAGWLQYGTKRMEARPFLVIQEEDYNEMAVIFTEWLGDRWR